MNYIAFIALSLMSVQAGKIFQLFFELLREPRIDLIFPRTTICSESMRYDQWIIMTRLSMLSKSLYRNDST